MLLFFQNIQGSLLEHFISSQLHTSKILFASKLCISLFNNVFSLYNMKTYCLLKK